MTVTSAGYVIPAYQMEGGILMKIKLKVEQDWRSLEFEFDNISEAVALIEQMIPACKKETTFSFVVFEEKPDQAEEDEE